MSGNDSAPVRLESVEKHFDQTVALQPTDLVVEAGEVLALLGPSGSGKSTVLSLIAGLAPPTRGRLNVLGTELTPTQPRLPASVRHEMGYVIQEGGLFPHLSARDNVGLLAKDIGWPADRVAARMQELAELVHLTPEHLDRDPGSLSGGQRQRVALMRALMLEPRLLLLDEPLGALDPITRHQLQGDLANIFSKLGTTVVLVTHDVGEAAFLASRIAVLGAGRIVQVGSAASIAEAPADEFVRAFLAAHRPAPTPTTQVAG